MHILPIATATGVMAALHAHGGLQPPGRVAELLVNGREQSQIRAVVPAAREQAKRVRLRRAHRPVPTDRERPPRPQPPAAVYLPVEHRLLVEHPIVAAIAQRRPAQRREHEPAVAPPRGPEVGADQVEVVAINFEKIDQPLGISQQAVTIGLHAKAGLEGHLPAPARARREVPRAARLR